MADGNADCGTCCLEQKVVELTMAAGCDTLQKLEKCGATHSQHEYCQPVARIGEGKQAAHDKKKLRAVPG